MLRLAVAAAALLLPGAAAAAAAPSSGRLSPVMPLELLDAAASTASGGVCLDGSPPGVFYRPAATAAANTSWVIYLQGGAWCTSLSDCANRAKGHLGSSAAFPPTLGFEGVLDPNPDANPSFADFHHALVPYCDGASFAGDAAEPVPVPGTNRTLYFRGARVLKAVLQYLADKHGLGSATHVLFGGGSAGGLATYLGADRVGVLLKAMGLPLQKYRAVPVSGFFLNHKVDDVAGELAFGQSMQAMSELHNCSGNVPPACVASLPPSEQWRCVLANYSYAHSTTPMFLLQSAVDLYQLFAIARLGGWDAGCLNRGIQFANCTEAQLVHIKEYSRSFMATLTASAKYSRQGEGGFVTSCLEHVAAQSSEFFDNYTIGGSSEQAALSRWWETDGTEPAAQHWSLPCALSESSPHQCNPSCFPPPPPPPPPLSSAAALPQATKESE